MEVSEIERYELTDDDKKAFEAIETYITTAEFGSTKAKAIDLAITLREVRSERKLELSQPEISPYNESEIRILELREAAAEATVGHESVMTPGFAKEYFAISQLLSPLSDVVLHPKDSLEENALGAVNRVSSTWNKHLRGDSSVQPLQKPNPSTIIPQ